MSVKEAEIRLSAQEGPCTCCGHPRLLTGARPLGSGCVWFSYCPVCRRVHEQAEIPGWFARGLPAPVPNRVLH